MSTKNPPHRRAATLVLLAATTLLFAGSVVAQAPAEIVAVTVSSQSTDASVEVQAAAELGWRSSLDENGWLILELPETVPGPGAVSMVSPTGLVASVDVGFSVPGGVPTTRLVVATRNPFEFDVQRGEGVLRLVLQSGEGAGRSAGARAAVESAFSPSAEIPVRSDAGGFEIEELRERLAQSESRQAQLERQLDEANDNAAQFRARAAELHKDRLGLLAELRSAQEAMARRPETAAAQGIPTAAEAGDLGSVQQDPGAARLSEVEAQLEAMRSAVEEKNDELAGLSSELVKERTAGQRAADRIRQLESEIETQTLALAEQRARTEQVAAELRAALVESEKSASGEAEASRLRQLLAEAPGLLGAEKFAVSERVDPCLNLRGEPGGEGLATDCLEPRTEVELLALRPEWFNVRLADGREGWLARQFLEPSYESRLETMADERDRALALLDTLRRDKSVLELELTNARSAVESLGEQREEVAELRRQIESARSERQARVAQAISLVDAVAVSAQVDSCLSLRAGPSKEEPALDCLPVGAALEPVDAVPGWISVVLGDDRRGWVAASYLEPAASRELRETREAESRSRAAAAEAERRSAAASEAQRQSEERLREALEASRVEAEALRTQFGTRISELDGALRLARAENERLRAQADEKRLAALALLGDTEVAVVAEPCLRLRSEARAEGTQIECLTKGTRARVADLIEGWARVELPDGRLGWAAAEYLEPVRREEQRQAAAQLAVARQANLNLDKELQSVRAERDDLDRRLTDLRSDRARFEAELADLRQVEGRTQALEEKLAAAREALAAAESDGGELRGRLQELEAEREAARDEASTLRQRVAELESVSGRTADLETRLTTAQGETEAAREEASTLRQRVAELELESGRTADLETQLTTAQGETEAAREEASTLRQRVAELELVSGRTADLETQLTTAQGETEAAREEASTLRQRVAELESVSGRTADLETELTTAQGEAEAARDEASMLRQRVTDLESVSGRTADLETELTKTQGEAEAAREEASALRQRVAELESVSGRTADLETRLTTAQGEAEAARDEASMLRQRVAELESMSGRTADLETELTTTQGEAEAAREEASTLRQRVAELESVSERTADLEAELTSVREALSVAEGGGAEIRARLSEAETERDRLRGKLATEQGRRTDAATALEAAQSEAEAARNEISTLRQRMADLEAASKQGTEAQTQLAAVRKQLAASKDARREQGELVREIERSRDELANRLEVAEGERQALAARTESAEIERAAAHAALAAARQELAGVEGLERPAAIESEDLAPPSKVEEAARSTERRPDAGDLEALARAWAQAWSEQRVEDYLYFYSDDFRPSKGMSRSAWEALRRRRISAPQSIEVELSDLAVRIDSNDSAAVTFSQTYRSDTFQDQVVKTLGLIREDGLWKIRSEQAQ